MLTNLVRKSLDNPHKTAIVNNDSSVSYVEFFQIIFGLMSWAPELIPQPSGTVAVRNRDMASGWMLILALRSLGFTTVHVPDVRILIELRLAGVVALFHDTLQSEELDALAIHCPNLPAFRIPPPVHLYELARETLPNGFEKLPFGGHIEYTSGSTGTYKAVLREGKLAQELCARAVREFRIGPDAVFHLNHMFPGTGVGNKVPLACWQMGATCIFDQRPDWMRHLYDHQPDRTFKAPWMMKQLSQLHPSTPPNPNLQVYCGGGFLSPMIARAVKSKLNCTLYLNYAATEFGVRLQNEVRSDEDTIWLQPLPAAGLEIVDENDKPVEDGEEGQLRVKRQICDPPTYLNAPEATRHHFRHGYFYSGDYAKRRSDGRIRILGREADVINLGGIKQSVEPFESTARDILEITSVCLFARQSDMGDDSLLIVVEGAKMPDVRAAQSLADRFIRDFSRIEFHLLPTFPRQTTAMAKIRRAEIFRMVGEQTRKLSFTQATRRPA